jgi:hypothetical protein
MALDQTRNLPSPLEDDVPIDPALFDQQDPTMPTCIGDMPQPQVTTMPSSMRKDKVEKRYYCGKCGKDFQILANLKVHAITHPAYYKEKVYGCNNHGCGRPCFKSWKELK